MTESITPSPRLVWDNPGYRTKLVIPDLNWQIFGHPTNFNYFVQTPLATAASAGREIKVGERKEHQRRAYVGATTTSRVRTHPRDWLYDPGRKVGSAIPGWSFILDDGVERRQFTTNGDVQNLILYLQDEVNNNTKLYTQGAVYYIKKPTAG
tara:strand:+ start:177 stop:632 length:456 start_codon:yes stop_codon:yes gene_type:complete